MRTIHKYQINGPKEYIEMPFGAIIVSVQNQNDTVQMWAVVYTEAAIEKRKFSAVCTGDKIESTDKHIGTVQIKGLVYHIIEHDA